MRNNDDLILAGYQNADLHDDGMLELVREGFRQAPADRPPYMQDYRVVGDRIVYDAGDDLPYAIMRTSDLDRPIQVADAGTTMTDAAPAEPTFGEKVGEASVFLDSLFSAPARGVVNLIANIVDAVDIENKTGAAEFVRMLRTVTEEGLEDASTATTVANFGGEVAGQIVVPGIAGFNVVKNVIAAGKHTGRLPNYLQNTLALVLTEIGVMGIADAPDNPLTMPLSNDLRATTRASNQGRGVLDEMGMASAQPYYDMLVDALAIDENTSEGRARMNKVAENMLLLGIAQPVVTGTIAALKRWKLLLAGGAATTLTGDDAEAAGLGPIIRGLIAPAKKAESNLRRLKKRYENVAKGKPMPGAPNLSRIVVKSSDPNLPDFVVGDVTFDDWIARTEKVLSSDEIAEAGAFYKDVRRVFSEYTEGDEALTDKYMRAWLVAQQNVDVSGALNNVLLQAEQFARSVPIEQMRAGGMPNPTGAARAVLQDEPIKTGVGQKIFDFVDAAEGKETRSWMGNDPGGGTPFVVDVHTARDTGLVDQKLINHLDRLGYDTAELKAAQEGRPFDFGDSVTETKYENRADFGRKLTDHLNSIGWQGRTDWTPSEVQAVGWGAMTKLTGGDAPTPARALVQNTRRISFEIDAGEGSPWANQFGERWSNLPFEAQATITRSVAERAMDVASKRAGIDTRRLVHATGGWTYEGDIGQAPAAVGEALATKEGAELAANIVGYLTNQTQVWVNSVKNATAKPKGFAIDLVEDGTRTLDSNEEVLRFWSELTSGDTSGMLGGYQMIRGDGGEPVMRLLINKPQGVGEAKFKQSVEKLVTGDITAVGEKQPFELLIDAYEADITITGNDWRKVPDGKGYLERISKLGGERAAADLDRDGSELTRFLDEEIRAAETGGSAGRKTRAEKVTEPDAAPTQNPPTEAGFLMGN